MSHLAHGTFSVDMDVRPLDPETEGLGQMRIRKTWTGEIEGTGWGLMISGGDPTTGTAGYVVMEVIEGSVHGRSGRFALQQFGTMQDGRFHQLYEAVPGSGTGELAGISGVLELRVEDGAHHYALTYDLT